MKETERPLFRKIKKYSKIIKDINNLYNFYESTNTLFLKEKSALVDKHKNGLLAYSKILDFLSSENINKDTSQLDNIILDNGKRLKKYMSFLLIESSKGDNKYSLKIDVESSTPDTINPIRSNEAINDCDEKMRILGNTVLENIVCIFETFLSSVFTSVLIFDPLPFIAEKTISFADIYVKNGEPITKIIEKEVEDKMFNSLSCLDTMLEKKSIFSQSITNELKKFREIYYRRNVVVHNDGIVNEKYIAGVGRENTSAKNGDKLICDEKYIKESIAVLIRLVSSIEYEFGKVFYMEMDSRLDELESYGFSCLLKKQYDIAEFIFNMLKADKDILFAQKLNYIINYLNAKKQQGKSIKNELQKLDVSATKDLYKIAKLCLEDRNKEVFDELQKTYPTSFDASQIRDWPIFINFRNTEFYNRFVECHKEDFTLYSIVGDEENITEDEEK